MTVLADVENNCPYILVLGKQGERAIVMALTVMISLLSKQLPYIHPRS